MFKLLAAPFANLLYLLGKQLHMGKQIPLIGPVLAGYANMFRSLWIPWAIYQTEKEKGNILGGIFYFFLAFLDICKPPLRGTVPQARLLMPFYFDVKIFYV